MKKHNLEIKPDTSNMIELINAEGKGDESCWNYQNTTQSKRGDMDHNGCISLPQTQSSDALELDNAEKTSNAS